MRKSRCLRSGSRVRSAVAVLASLFSSFLSPHLIPLVSFFILVLFLTRVAYCLALECGVNPIYPYRWETVRAELGVAIKKLATRS